MASASAISEDSFLCPICLDLFSQPVAIPCGHSFCKTCITKYWDSSDVCHCPMCKKAFDRTPDLCVSRLISELAAYFKKSSLDAPIPIPEEVSCEVCSDTKIKAVKTCLSCVASYCETHLEPHHKVAALKMHKLVDPVKLEDRVCKEHGKMLELFCRKDHKCICVTCSKTDHKDHDTALIDVEYEEKRLQLDKTKAELQKMIRERLENILQFKITVATNTIMAKTEKADTVKVCSALVSSIKRTEAELIEVIELKTRSAKREAEGLIKKLEEEVTYLQRKSTELERFSHTEDHLHLLQSFPSCYNLNHFKSKLSEVKLSCEVSVKAVRTAITQLQKTLEGEMEKLPEVMLNKIQQKYAVDVTLDPDTAHPNLILSLDRKQVKYGKVKKILPDKSEVPCVLGKEGFYLGKAYYEVQLKGKTTWIIGVVEKFFDRKTAHLSSLTSFKMLQVGGNYPASCAFITPNFDVQKIGVFVDCDGKQVSYFDVETRALLCRSTCSTKLNIFKKVFPMFYPLTPYHGSLIISPVTQK